MNAAAQRSPSESTLQGGRNRRAGKAVLAGAVAVGLLAAGGSTFSARSGSDHVASGELRLGLASGAVRTDGNGQEIGLDTYEVVPGDTVEPKVSPVVQDEGENPEGALALDLTADLESAVGAFIDHELQLSDPTEANGDRAYEVAGSTDDDRTVDVTATFTGRADG